VPAQPLVLNVPIAPFEALLLIATRLLAALATSPVLSARTVPGPARIGLGVFAALVMLPVVSPDSTMDAVSLSWTTIAGEAVTGALAGFAATLVYAAVQFGAGLIDIQAGFGMGSTYDPTFGTSGSVVERFYTALAALLFLEVNGHHLLLSALRDLFVLVPLGSFSAAHLHPAWLAEIAAGMFRAAIQLVLPVVGALLLADVALALLVRAAPQFNLFAVGTPAKIGISLAALVLALPLAAPHLKALFEAVAGASVGVFR
jgi:flagellar biosynthetic protein FliR